MLSRPEELTVILEGVPSGWARRRRRFQAGWGTFPANQAMGIGFRQQETRNGKVAGKVSSLGLEMLVE